MKKAKIILMLGATSTSFVLSGCGQMNPGTVEAALGTVSQLATTGANVANLANVLSSPGGGSPTTAPAAAVTGTTQLQNRVAASFIQYAPSLEGGTPGLIFGEGYAADTGDPALATRSARQNTPRVQQPTDVATDPKALVRSTDLMGARRRQAEAESDARLEEARREAEPVTPSASPGREVSPDDGTRRLQEQLRVIEAEREEGDRYSQVRPPW